LRSSTASPHTPCSSTNVFVAPRIALSSTTIRCYPRLWLASSMTLRMAIETSPVSSVNIPTCPSCPSSLTIWLSQIAATGSSYAGALGLLLDTTMSSVIQQPRCLRYYHLASISFVRLAWRSIQQPPRTSM
jgi:hypothetical protein